MKKKELKEKITQLEETISGMELQIRTLTAKMIKVEMDFKTVSSSTVTLINRCNGIERDLKGNVKSRFEDNEGKIKNLYNKTNFLKQMIGDLQSEFGNGITGEQFEEIKESVFNRINTTYQHYKSLSQMYDELNRRLNKIEKGQ